MHLPLTELLYTAEDRYLESADLVKLEGIVSNLSAAIAVHNVIRENEIDIFQAIANKLTREFKDTQEATIENVLCHWLTILRYCTMAMVLDNPEFLNQRLLEWLHELVKVNQKSAIELRTYEILVEQLSQILSAEQVSAIEPFLEMAHRSICENLDLQLN